MIEKSVPSPGPKFLKGKKYEINDHEGTVKFAMGQFQTLAVARE
jgi:hypothetical protein